MDGSITVVLPYYNEAAFLPATLQSLLAQTRPAEQLILVDNGSTDGSAEVCRRVVAACSGAGCSAAEVCYLSEPRPGKIHALEHAARHVRTEYVAFVDADTYYPPHYLETCSELFRRGGSRRVAVMAKALSGPPDSWSGRWARWFYAGLSRVLYWQAFSGGCAQAFRTAAFRAAGGYSAERWKYTLEDHEIMNRMRKVGRFCYHPRLWCRPAARRGDRSRVAWNLGERLLYHLTPPVCGDWFFNRFLAARFERRQIYQANLRVQDWNTQSAPAAESSRAA